MQEEITFKEAFKQLANFGLPIWLGVGSAIIVFIIEIILCSKKIIFAGNDKKIEDAKKKGNILKATRISCRFNDRETKNSSLNRTWIAKYKYNLNGLEKTKQIISKSIEPPYTIDLYYTSNGKVLSGYDSSNNPLKILLYILPILVAYLVVKIFS